MGTDFEKKLKERAV
ncbi:hypothetical protein ACSLNR_24950, partial [Escherichia coli]